MNRTIFALQIGIALLSMSFALANTEASQKEEKPWTQWTQKEAEKMLSDSPWARTQIDTDTSEMVYTPTSKGGGSSGTSRAETIGGTNTDRQSVNNNRVEQGATNQSVNVKFTVRIFSARPVRRAFVRLMELKQKPDADVLQKLHNFADVKSTDSIILTVSFESSDQRYSAVAMEALNGAVTATLKNETYLERDGKRLFLEEYVPPGRDGFGARFIFLRQMDGQPFISDNTGEVRFHTKYPVGIKVDRRFKISEMIYNGELEY